MQTVSDPLVIKAVSEAIKQVASLTHEWGIIILAVIAYQSQKRLDRHGKKLDALMLAATPPAQPVAVPVTAAANNDQGSDQQVLPLDGGSAAS